KGTMTALRKRFIEDLQLHGLAPTTQQVYVCAIKQLAKHYGQAPDQLSEEQIRQYFLRLIQANLGHRSPKTTALYTHLTETAQTIFRAKMRDTLRHAKLLHPPPPLVWKQPWVVHAQHAGAGDKALAYLARYVFRVAITNSRLESFQNDQVHFPVSRQPH